MHLWKFNYEMQIPAYMPYIAIAYVGAGSCQDSTEVKMTEIDF